MLDCADKVMPEIMKHEVTPDSVSIVSGLAGACSAFKVHVIRAAKTFNLDSRDIFMEVGRRKAVSGQEDIVIEVAQDLISRKLNHRNDYQIGALI